MIDPVLKRSLGQMIKGVEVVGAHHDGVTRAYTSHWVTQVSFEEPIVMASVSPKHDTYPLMVASGRFSVSILAGDQIEAGQYFSYPGRKFRHIADEHLVPLGGEGPGATLPVVRNCIAWLHCEVFQQLTMADHELLFARVLTATVAQTAPVFLAGFVTSQGLFLAKVCAAAVVVSLPVLVAGFAAQDKLVQGLSLGAVK